ncbi:MAG: hypothetical protein LBJ48_04285 [Coriobacteriales bacterium]|jgi:hypothetical protein|nr:hypothetical protein [Coriobacteriales bacterium]
MAFTTLIFILTPIIADSSDSDAVAAAPLLLLLSGFVFYGYIYARYRNADKRHSHERETSAKTANLGQIDTFIQSRKGLSNARMQGANQDRIEGALNQGGEGAGNKLLKEFMPLLGQGQKQE